MSIRSALTLCCALALPTPPAAAQSVLDLLQSIQRGGGWVSVPIQQGEGEVRTAAMPALGLTLAGCMRIWHGHSGRWQIEARDLLGEGRLDADVEADQAVPFSYAPDGRAQLEVRFRWSEPRDTTLVLWVGLSTGAPGRDPCEPYYGEGARSGLP